MTAEEMNAADMGTAAFYREVAERVENASDEELWLSFGRDVYERTREESAFGHEYAGYPVAVTAMSYGPEIPFEQFLSFEMRQTGDDRTALENGALAQAVDVFVVLPVTMRRPAGTIRRSLVRALREAADEVETEE